MPLGISCVTCTFWTLTRTPSGIGAVKPGDRLEGGIEGLEVLRNTIVAPARD